MPWTHERLASASGYGAGVDLARAGTTTCGPPRTRPIARWLTKVARALRQRDLPASSAHVIEAVRLAETLASLRGRPLAGLTEVTEATRAVLCDGDERAVRYVTEHLVVGQALGSVNDRVPTVPLEADLVTTCRTLRVRREPESAALGPRPAPADRPGAVPAVPPAPAARAGLDRSRRESDDPEPGHVPRDLGVALAAGVLRALVEASVWGTTVESAATARVEQDRRDRAPCWS